jgi:O-antigen/teichoic acid export membrane protein
VDVFMLDRLIPDEGYEAGVYASTFRLFDAGNSFTYLFAVLLLPMFSRLISLNEPIKNLFRSTALFLYVNIVIV